jgi:hypothetical protein
VIPFDYRRADDARGAVAAVAERPDAVFLGAGTNLVDHMKLGVANPGLVVDVSRLPFGAIEPLEHGGVRIGATVRNSDLAAEPMTMGVSMALHEHSVMDPRFGQVANHDFAGYHIAANADIGSIDAIWVEEDDPHVNPMGSKGIGEIGIVGTAAAIANAVHHATGVRVRDLPITVEKLLGLVR